MARITILIYDDEDGENAIVEFVPDPDFEGDDEELTTAQHVAMRAMEAICDEADVMIPEGNDGSSRVQ